MDEEIRESKNKVILRSSVNLSKHVTCLASPQVTENRTVNYQALEPLHAPGQIQVYKNTGSRTFTVSDVKIISRTTEEADSNLKRLWTLRSWCMPRFGNSSTLDDDNVAAREERQNETNLNNQETSGKSNADINELYVDKVGTELLGAPPEVLYLSAYSYAIGPDPSQNASQPGTSVWQRAQHINRVPVVINSLTIPYPNDVDYINTTDGTPMPIILNIDISLIETHSPNAYESFSLDDFRAGILTGF